MQLGAEALASTPGPQQCFYKGKVGRSKDCEGVSVGDAWKGMGGLTCSPHLPTPSLAVSLGGCSTRLSSAPCTHGPGWGEVQPQPQSPRATSLHGRLSVISRVCGDLCPTAMLGGS